MILWIVMTVMVSAAGAALAVALVRRQDERRDRPGEAAALRAELADLESQVAAGTLPKTTAEGLRAETIRRFLGSDSSATSPKPRLGRGAQMTLAVALAAVVALGASLLYAKLGRPDLADGHAPPVASPDASPQAAQVADLLPGLEAKVRANPNDAQGLKLLGGAYMDVGRYGEAAGVFARLAGLTPRDADVRSAQGEALVRASGGTVTPAAAAAFRSAVSLDPADPRARYFLALRKDQQGDHAGAMDDWIALLKSAPTGAAWADQVRAFVEQEAAQRHEDLSGRLPPAAPARDSVAPGQQAMVRGMVDRLDARLKAAPRDAQGWIMLMRARMVLGEPDAAAEALNRGREAFSGSPDEQQTLDRAARQLGVPRA